ncbi:MAG TPA: nuclear transport factor 2 family protein [Burkholderiaceae bacterium]|nr:nuclear transport factor 2 family protein [Burkholderiaceae bacterium]
MTRRGVVALVSAIAVVAGCGRSDPERELRATIESMTQAVEKRDPAAFLEAMTDDFSRESGGFGKPDAKRTLVAAILRNEKIDLGAAVTEVRIEGDRAYARVRVIATGGAGLLPERGQTWDFETAWRRERGQWKVFNAEWREGLQAR